MYGGSTQPAGDLALKVIRASDEKVIRGRFDQIVSAANWPARELSLGDIARFGLPGRGLDDEVNAWRTWNFRHLMRGARRVLTARTLHLATMYGSLFVTHLRADGTVIPLGLASMRVVTTAGVNFIVDAFQNSTELENLKYHGVGVGTTAEASADTALVTESTTIINPDSTRATGSTTEGASANIYRTVGTVTFDGSGAITEHGIFSQAATGGGTLLDRSVFAAVNVASGDSIQFTYDLTMPAGS